MMISSPPLTGPRNGLSSTRTSNPMCSPAFSRALPYSTLFVLLTSLATLADAHALPYALPRPTVTAAYRTLDVEPWLVARAPEPTPLTNPLAYGLDNLFGLVPRLRQPPLRRQDLIRTICGYIGGDPDIPATCGAGSHCVVDRGAGAIGCCPDADPICTTGIFTGCVDYNSGPQTEVNPYVFTCQGSNVCYRNAFDGGYFQFGCGTASNLAASVATAVSGASEPLEFSTQSLPLTAQASTLLEPTTIGSAPSTATAPSTVSSLSSASTESESTTASTTASTTTSTTSSSTTTTSTTSSTSSSTSDLVPLATAAPAESNTRPRNLGAIIGGTISGVAILCAIAAVAFYLTVKRKGNTREGPGQQSTQYISPMSHGDFKPLPGSMEAAAAASMGGRGVDPNTDQGPPYPNRSSTAPHNRAPPLGYHPIYGATTLGAAAAGAHSSSGAPGTATDGSPSVGSDDDNDRVPLNRQFDEFHQGFTDAIDRVGGNGDSPRRRPGEEPPLWEQGRQQSRNMVWI